jgi:hypothetical protein
MSLRLGLIISMISLSSCGCSLYYSTILIENESSYTAEDIVVVSRGERFGIGSIAPGGSVTKRIRFREEATSGDPMIYFRINGRQINRELCYYTGMDPFDGKVTITDESADVRCDN